MNLTDISTQLLYTTVQLWVDVDNSTSRVGTAFIFAASADSSRPGTIPFLVTNKHVIQGARRAVFGLVEGENNAPTNRRVNVEVNGSDLHKYVSADLDLAAIPVGPVVNHIQTQGKSVFFRSVTPDLVPKPEVVQDLAAVEEITFIGYPSGIMDDHNQVPLVRKGITATPIWNNFQNQPAFLIDAGVFPGSSGSPVFIMNQGSYATRGGISIGSRLLFVGAISESMIRGTPNNNVYLGLGKVINSQAILVFIQGLVRQLTPTAIPNP